MRRPSVRPTGGIWRTIEIMNADASTYMASVGIPQVDFWSPIVKHCGPLPYSTCDIVFGSTPGHPANASSNPHYTAEGYELLVNALVPAIKAALKETSFTSSNVPQKSDDQSNEGNDPSSTPIGSSAAVPTPEQVEYQDLEVGALIHFNLQTLCTFAEGHSGTKCQKFGYLPTEEDIRAWNPSNLNTDQWLEAVVSFGGRYAVLVVDHFSGFTLWPTKLGNYSIAMTAWRDGRGDVLADFIQSCKKYNVKPGVFYSVHMNWHKHVSNYAVNTKHGAGSQADYNLYANGQITELLTNYGDLLGLWLDAGARNDLNPELGPTVRRLQPTALCHNCLGFTQDPHDSSRGYGLRWAGNENGAVREPSWGATNSPGQNQSAPGGSKENFSGDPLGAYYCPAEGDTVLRQHYWFWVNGTANKTKDTESLLNSYFSTVGNAGNLILDIGPDSTGAIPSSDVAAYYKFGNAVKCVFQHPLGNATNTSFRECSTNGTLSYCWGGPADHPGEESTPA
jgi:alpha-L-fucosidase